jgi:lipoprotein-anchoring transpeptidase ErfK/SrfK
MKGNQFIYIGVSNQRLQCFENDVLIKTYIISTAKNGLGEKKGSECTPRGWHTVHNKIGMSAEINSVFVGRVWTGEIYSSKLGAEFPNRDWILTRIIQLDGLEPGRNKGGEVDTLERFIYIHGVPDTIKLGTPDSHGCIRMSNQDVIEFADWVLVGSKVCIE